MEPFSLRQAQVALTAGAPPGGPIPDRAEAARRAGGRRSTLWRRLEEDGLDWAVPLAPDPRGGPT